MNHPNKYTVMKQTILLIAVLSVTFACKKEKHKAPEEKKTPLKLITQKKWISSSFGFDDNKNGKIDGAEEMIRDCETDNTVEFFTDSTGVGKENQKTCGNGNPVNPFKWQFDGTNKILIENNSATIVTLNEDSLVLLYHIQYVVDGFMATYKH
jgi:hypothetical protein